MIPETDAGLSTLAHKAVTNFPILYAKEDSLLLDAAHASVDEAFTHFEEITNALNTAKIDYEQAVIEAETFMVQLQDQVRDAWRQFKRADKRGYGKRSVYYVTKTPRTFLPRNNNLQDWLFCANQLIHGYEMARGFGLRIPVQIDLLRHFMTSCEGLLGKKWRAHDVKKAAVKERQTARIRLQSALKTLRYAVETHFAHLELAEINSKVRELGYPLKSLTEKRRKRRQKAAEDTQPLSLEAPKKDEPANEVAIVRNEPDDPNVITVEAEVIEEFPQTKTKKAKKKDPKAKKTPREQAALRRKLRKRIIKAHCEDPGNPFTGCFMDPPEEYEEKNDIRKMKNSRLPT